MNGKKNKNLRYIINKEKWGGEIFYRNESSIKRSVASQFLDFRFMSGLGDMTSEEMIEKGIFNNHFFIPTHDAMKMFEVVDFNQIGKEINSSWFPLNNLQLLAAGHPDGHIESYQEWEIEPFYYLIFRDISVDEK